MNKLEMKSHAIMAIFLVLAVTFWIVVFGGGSIIEVGDFLADVAIRKILN